MAKTVSLNNLVKYSPWLDNYLKTKSIHHLKKNIYSVRREFGSQKWQIMVEKIKDTQPKTFYELENLFNDLNETRCYYERGEFKLGKNKHCYNKYIDYLINEILPFCNDIPSICEFGAGYGSKIIPIAEKLKLDCPKYIGLELTESGQDAIINSSKSIGIDITVGHCNIVNGVLDNSLIPNDSVLFTCYAAHYEPEFNETFVDNFLSVNPRVVIHLEPVYEHFVDKTLYDYLCRLYIEYNDYTRNLLSTLKSAEKRGRIKIIKEEIKVFGSNPLLPFSVINWIPN